MNKRISQIDSLEKNSNRRLQAMDFNSIQEDGRFDSGIFLLEFLG